MVVALMALFMSLGGVSYGLARWITGREIKNNTITFKDVRKDTLGGGSIKESTLGTVPASLVAHGSTHFSVVNAGGQQVRARGTTSAARTAEGRYQVIFDRDVRGCAYYATVGGPTAAAPPDNGQITVSGLASNVNGVDIRTTKRTATTPTSRSTYSFSAEPAPEAEGYSTRRSTFAGAPAAIENGGMSAVTTLFAPITQRSPTVTPLVTTTLAPHQTLSPTRVGPLLVKPCHVIG